MNKKTTILLHVASWLAILCAPLMYIDRSATFDVLRYLFFSMTPALLMVVFYSNYVWFVPKYYIPGNRTQFSIINICMVILLSVFLHLWMDFGHNVFPTPHRIPRKVDIIDNHRALIFAIRDIFMPPFYNKCPVFGKRARSEPRMPFPKVSLLWQTAMPALD